MKFTESRDTATTPTTTTPTSAFTVAHDYLLFCPLGSFSQSKHGAAM
jgi:hypothetical protein